MKIFDMLLANAMMGEGGGGGGGSSDFSTANVTVINNTYERSIFAPYSMDRDGYSWAGSEAFAEAGTSTFSAILYKGQCLAYINLAGITVSISGDIADDGDGYYYITGDCTITIS